MSRSLSILAVLALLPTAPAAAAEPAKGSADPVTQCIKDSEERGDGGGTLAQAQCMVEYREALKTEQATIVARIGRTLAGKGPEGTDYKAAASEFAAAQRNWDQFIGADCAIVGDVFGYGTAMGLAGEDCVIEHYTARNAQLRALEENYLQP